MIAKGDFVRISACPSHSAAESDDLPNTLESRRPCWCTGRVQRVFWDGSVLVAGKDGWLCAFNPEEVASEA